MLRRTHVVLLLLLLVAALAEGTGRISFWGTWLAPASVRAGGTTAQSVLAPGLDGGCGGVRLATDAAGQRRDFTAGLARAWTAPILVVGGQVAAGVGLAESELYPTQLEQRLKGRGVDGVLAAAVAGDKPQRVRDLLAKVRRVPAAAGPHLNLAPHDAGPDLIVIEVEPADLEADATPFEMTRPEAGLPNVALEPAPDSGAPLALVAGLRCWREQRSRAALERDVLELVQREGFTARAAGFAHLRLAHFTTAVQERHCGAAETRFLRALLADLHGLDRQERRDPLLASWRALFDELRMQQRAVVLLVTGPTLLTLGIRQEAYRCGVPVVHAAPFDLDPRLRVPVPEERPAAAVHAQIADSLWALLTQRNVLPAEAAAPAAVTERSDEIEAQVLARGGLDEALIALAHSLLTDHLTLGDDALPPCVLRGLAPGGLLAAGATAELLLALPLFPQELVVRAEAPEGVAPALTVRHSGGTFTSAPKQVGTRLLEFRVPAPVSRRAYDYPAIELSFPAPAPGAAAPRLQLQLKELTITHAPRDEDAKEEDGKR